MPSLTRPAQMPAEISALAQVIGNRARTEILRSLALAPSTVTELATAIDLSTVSVWRHLGALEALGLVSADHPAGARVGTTVHWRTAAAEVQAVAAQWVAYATGVSPDVSPAD